MLFLWAGRRGAVGSCGGTAMRRRTLFCASLLALALGTTVAWADEPARTHDITVDDYFTQADIFQCKMSHDGKRVAYVEGRWQKSTNDRKTDLWVVETASGKGRRLTQERANDRSPQWAPDGKALYFLGNRKRAGEKKAPYNGKAQVWRVGLGGGEPLAVTRVDDGVGDFALAPDGRAVYYVTSTERIDGPWKALRQKFKDIEYGHGVVKVSEVWRLDLDGWRAEKVIDDHRVIREFSVGPGGRIAMITTPDDKVVSFEGQSRVDVYDAKKKKTTTLPDRVFRAEAPSPYAWLENLAWSQDGSALAWNAVFDAYPAEVIVARWDADGPTVFKMPRPAGVSLRGYGSPLAWRADGALGFLAEEKARVRLCCARDLKPGARPEYYLLTPGDVVVSAFGFGKSDGSAAVVMNDAAHLPDVYFLAGKYGRPRRLTKVNPQADRWKVPQVSVVAWKGANGDPVEGILELPPGYKPGKRVPLVVEIHGGPTTAAYLGMQFWIYGRTLLPAKGYAVLCPNYRGSTGYGDKFLTELVGRENDLDVKDILAGVDALVERGIADPDRLAVSGWSNGGYLTNCILTHTTRFKAAISGAGVVDAVLEFGANDEPAYAIVFKQGLPWTAAARYQRASPSYGLGNVRTPTLIHVGGADERCPPANSRMLYRALKEYGHVPTELLVYPGEPHGLTKYGSRRAKMEWDLAWLERYVLGKAGK
jgi:dipeptidyl aminopeptidase/acylaminoacyl peptidase